jgi:hypothetical protein
MTSEDGLVGLYGFTHWWWEGERQLKPFQIIRKASNDRYVVQMFDGKKPSGILVSNEKHLFHAKLYATVEVCLKEYCEAVRTAAARRQEAF